MNLSRSVHLIWGYLPYRSFNLLNPFNPLSPLNSLSPNSPLSPLINSFTVRIRGTDLSLLALGGRLRRELPSIARIHAGLVGPILVCLLSLYGLFKLYGYDEMRRRSF